MSTTDERLRNWIASHRRVFALTGAGCSTASGIPDYRDDEGGWKRRPPVMIQAFRAQDAVYRRYWARAYAGWPHLTAAAPNAAHRAFAAWEAAGTLVHLVTQNVDGLHQRAGSRAVIDLHGRLDLVVCLGCGDQTSRDSVQEAMAAANPWWRTEAATAPDGDADVEAAVIESFAAPRCERVRRPVEAGRRLFRRKRAARSVRARARGARRRGRAARRGFVAMVFSGFRFVRLAHEAALPIAIVNRGRTRGDDLAGLKVEHDVGSTLTADGWPRSPKPSHRRHSLTRTLRLHAVLWQGRAARAAASSLRQETTWRMLRRCRRLAVRTHHGFVMPLVYPRVDRTD